MSAPAGSTQSLSLPGNPPQGHSWLSATRIRAAAVGRAARRAKPCGGVSTAPQLCRVMVGTGQYDNHFSRNGLMGLRRTAGRRTFRTSAFDGLFQLCPIGKLENRAKSPRILGWSRSSAGQSTCLLSRGSQVRALPGSPGNINNLGLTTTFRGVDLRNVSGPAAVDSLAAMALCHPVRARRCVNLG
jgi:hypothetical protein